MVFNWNDKKNEHLKETRNINFEKIVVAIENNQILDVLENQNKKYKDQIIIVVNFENYAYAVPALRTDTEYFLKTIYPSRKLTDKYLKSKEDEDENK